MSFLLDTGAPKHLYLCDEAMNALEAAGLTAEDEDTDIRYTKLFGRNCVIELTPAIHQPADIIGLKVLKRLGLEPHFSFSNPFPYFCADSL